jgi:hypothetical protein
LLSANSVCLHIALTEGHNIAWWFRATRSDATIQDLHEFWAFGTSTVSAIKSGRKFNYIALATLFVATIPLNGLILQNAIAIVPVFKTTNLYSTLPTQTSVPLGWSAPINSDGTIGLLGGQTSFRIATFLGGDNTVEYGATALPCAAGATCTGYLPSVGFWTTCTNTTVPFDLPADNASNLTSNATIFSSSLNWDKLKPNQIALRTQWKAEAVDGTSPCTGSYQVRDCTMQAAVLNQTVFMSSTIPQTEFGPAPARYSLTLDPAHDSTSDKLIDILPVLAGEGITNTTYGGIAAVLSNYLSGSVNVSYVDGKPSIRSSGLYASLASITLPSSDDGTSISQCNYTAGDGLTDDFSDTMINSVRQLFW